MDKILIVDDEPDIRGLIKDILEDEGYMAYTASSGTDAEKLLLTSQPDLMLLDIWMPGMDGITLLRRVSEKSNPAYPIIVMSGHGTVETAVEATRLGAFDYVEKPLSTSKLLDSVRRALDSRQVQSSDILLHEQNVDEEFFTGKSDAIQALRQLVATADNNNPILLYGEHGVGKELLARSICRGKPQLLPLHCLYTGEAAAGNVLRLLQQQLAREDLGTLYINDVADIGADGQKLLAEYIKQGEQRHHDSGARLIMATADNLEALPRQLQQHNTVRVPPLTERVKDIPELLEYYANLHSSKYDLPYRHFSVASQNMLRTYDWPGNLRELRELSHALLTSGKSGDIEPEEIEQQLQSPDQLQHGFSAPLRVAKQQFERRYILHHLRQANYNISKVAARIGIERTYLYRKMRDLNIKVRE